jgi:hypothetical protein
MVELFFNLLMLSMTNIPEFLSLRGGNNTVFIVRYEFIPQSWNNGIVERWNNGFSNDIIHFKIYRSAFGEPFTQYCSIPRPIFPIFQHSTFPIGAKPLTCTFEKKWIKKKRSGSAGTNAKKRS